MITPKEQTELTRHLAKAVKLVTAPLDSKEIIYISFLDGMQSVEGFDDTNITGFCSILDRVIYKRRNKK